MNPSNPPSEVEDLDDLDLDPGASTVGSEPGKEGLPAGEAFYDASKVPDELKPTFKEMQAAFTRKQQALADQQRAVAAGAYKAETFDRLMANPRVVQALNQIANEVDGGTPSGNGSEGEEVDPSVYRALQRTIAPLQDELQRLRVATAVEQEKNVFVTAHPDWEQYKDGMAEAWRRDQSLSMEAAYRWAKSEVLSQKYEAAKKRAEARGGVVEGRGASRGVADLAEGKAPRTMVEAAEIARKALGIPRDAMP